MPHGALHAKTTPPKRAASAAVRDTERRRRAPRSSGAHLRLLVLSSSSEDITAIDVASGAFVRVRVGWSDGGAPDLEPFSVVDASLAADPEPDDLAQPEAVSISGEPVVLGTLRGRRAARLLSRLAVSYDGPLLGFAGPSAPYWDFHGVRPSVALVRLPARSQFISRTPPQSPCVRFQWGRDDVWLPIEDRRARHVLERSPAGSLSGKPLAGALGFAPFYLLATVSRPRAGHCYKLCAAVLPRA